MSKTPQPTSIWRPAPRPDRAWLLEALGGALGGLLNTVQIGLGLMVLNWFAVTFIGLPVLSLWWLWPVAVFQVACGILMAAPMTRGRTARRFLLQWFLASAVTLPAIFATLEIIKTQ